MKKYEAPKIEVVRFGAIDIIQTSGEATPQSLNTFGLNLGSANAAEIFE